MCETKSFTLWLLQIVLLLGFIVFFLWLSMRPRQPTYTIVQFSLPTSPVGHGTQNGTASFELEVENPNKDSGIYYDDTWLTFYYGKETLGQKTILSSYQKKDSRNQIFDHLNVDSRVWKKLIGAISNATAELKVAVLTKIRYRMWGHTSKHQGINLHGKIPIGSDGKIAGKKKKIKLHYNSKKWRK
ncbi:hypothetical protein CEY00_Acc17435 [Actinidia chinensis var. chinensis]|uniref:Uncharacterized protein n=1 Tax=Actinidia chinensis var. chinensis TaxID=1590841 RepID=A0A2R6QLQ9_ACTCC|nr:hypothetical protein CEY00_Acc17435 [Actinidia chinensis var. chinensis]